MVASGRRSPLRRRPRSSSDLDEKVLRISAAGGTPLVVARVRDWRRYQVLGVIYLKDIVKDGAYPRSSLTCARWASAP